MTAAHTYVALSLLVVGSSTLGGVLGFGTAAILLPVLSLSFGVKTAVPVLGVAMIFANASRAIFSWREIDWKAVAAFSAASVPGSLLGALVFVGSSGRWINGVIAVVVLLAVPLRRIALHFDAQVRLKHLPFLGGIVGAISGMGGVVGPAATPFLLSYGLSKGAYLGTDGANSTLVHGAKTLVYVAAGQVAPASALFGLGLGVLMVGGSFLGRCLVDRLDARQFTVTVEVFLVLLGAMMLAQAVLRP